MKNLLGCVRTAIVVTYTNAYRKTCRVADDSGGARKILTVRMMLRGPARLGSKDYECRRPSPDRTNGTTTKVATCSVHPRHKGVLELAYYIVVELDDSANCTIPH
jgi:hypothetical protein